MAIDKGGMWNSQVTTPDVALVNEAHLDFTDTLMHHFTAFSTWLHNFTLLHQLQARRLPSLSTTINKVLLSSTAILSA
jgi:hypothetical protein